MRIAMVIGLVVCAVGTAHGATNQAKNRCNDAVRILRTNPTMLDVSQELDPLTVENAVKHWNQVLDGWNRASKQIDQIPKADLDEHDPDLAECFTEVRKWGAYIKALDGRIKSAQEQAKVVRPFLAEVKAYRESLWPFVLTHYFDADAFTNRKPADAKAALDDLAKVEAVCAKSLPAAGAAMPELTPAGAGQVRGGVPAAYENKPDVWCYVAKNRVKLMGKALAQKPFHAEGYGNYGIEFPDTLASFAKGGTGVMVWVAIVMADPSDFKKGLLADAKAWYGAVGLPVPADPFAWVDGMVAKLRAGAEAAIASVVFEDKGLHDKKLEALGRAAVKKAEPRSKILASTMDAADFTISKNAADLPVDRFRSGRVLIKRPGATWCEERTFSYVEPYQGGGKFQKAKAATLTEATRLVRCP